MEHLCGDERQTLARMKYGNRKEFQANSLPSLLSLPRSRSKAWRQRHSAPLPRVPHRVPAPRQAPRPLRPAALFLWLSSLLFRISSYQFLLANFLHLTTTQTKRSEKIGNFSVFLLWINKQKKIFWGKTRKTKKEKRLEILVFFLLWINKQIKK